MKCPYCQQYSMTYDYWRNQWTCHVYNTVIRDENMPNPLVLQPLHRLGVGITRMADKLESLSVELNRIAEALT